MKKKIVIVSAFLTPHRSGAEACVEEISKRLNDRYDITIVTSKWRRNLPRKGTHEGVKVIRVGLGFSCDKWLFPFLAPFKVRALRPDLIHAVLESYAGAAMIVCSFLMPYIPRILTCQSTNTDALLKPMHKRATGMTAISKVLIERAKKWGRDDVTLITNGLTLAEVDSALRQTEKVEGRIVFVGRLRPMKGVDILLQAFAKLLEATTRDDLHLRLVGEGYQREMLEQVAKDLNIEDRVEFVGYLPVKKTLEEFAQAPVFCCLSRHEAFGNVFAEAQAAECAIVGTNIEGIPEIVTDGENGLLVPMNDSDAAAAALLTLFEDEELRKALVTAGKENAQSFDWSIVTEKYAQVYDNFLSRTI